MKWRMNNTPRVLALIVLFSGLVAHAAPSRPSDLVPPPKRQPTVMTAKQLALAPQAASLPADVPNPFNPVDFDQPQGEAAKATTAGATAAAIELPRSDLEMLEVLVSRIPSAGTMSYQGKLEIFLGGNRIGLGQVFTVPHNNRDYDLELVAITSTTFTLKYRDAMITRPMRQTGR
jgi:hypothetical protein